MTEATSAGSDKGEPAPDRIIEIERLAALEPIAYEVVRSDAAKRLGLRAHILDGEVGRTRRALGLDNGKEEDGQGQAVRIPDVTPWLEPVDGDFVATALAAAVKTYAVLPDHTADAIALWVLHTWVMNSFTTSPRLAVTSPTKGCGKTTVLRFLNKVARRPKRAGSLSPSALFRVVDMFQPTILLDETEKYIEHGGDLHALLNEGHCKGGTVLRVLGEKLELREFGVFGAVAFARNGALPDDLEQRSIVVEMQRRRPDEALAELRDDRCPSLEMLARKCARWAEDNAGELKDADPDMGGLINRAADNWRPLFAIADAIGSDWPERARSAALALMPNEADSQGSVLLTDIKTIFDDRDRDAGEWTDRIFSETLAEALATIEGGKWAEYGKSRKPISKNQLAQLLKAFNVAPASVRVGSKSLKGYYRHQFEDVWMRYLGRGVHETSQRHNPSATGTSSMFPHVTPETDVTDEKCQKPLQHSHCDVVTFQNGVSHLGVRGCDHCRRPGDDTNPLLEVAYGQGHAWVHRACLSGWTARYEEDHDQTGGRQ
jgi:putative DNA primase/helicase